MPRIQGSTASNLSPFASQPPYLHSADCNNNDNFSILSVPNHTFMDNQSNWTMNDDCHSFARFQSMNNGNCKICEQMCDSQVFSPTTNIPLNTINYNTHPPISSSVP